MDLEPNWVLRMGISLTVLILVGSTAYAAEQMLCQMNVRTCQYDAECLSGAACVDSHCTPRMCLPVTIAKEKVIASIQQAYHQVIWTFTHLSPSNK